MAQKCTKILPLSSQTLNPSLSLFLFGFRLHRQLKLWNRLLSAASALSAAAKMLRTSPKSETSQVWSSLAQLVFFWQGGQSKKCDFYKTLCFRQLFLMVSWDLPPVPEAMYKPTFWALEGRFVSSKSPEESEKRDLLEGTKEKNVIPCVIIFLPSLIFLQKR